VRRADLGARGLVTVPYARAIARQSEDVLTDPPPPAADSRLAYGPEPKQFGDLRLPRGDGPFPLAVVIHGGNWKALYNLVHTGHACIALADAGIATWNVEYRCVGDVGGAWPAPAYDVGRAITFVDELTQTYPLDRNRVVLVGHSAGGQLALWTAKHAQLPVLALAAVSDLRASPESMGGDGAIARLMGGTPADVPERYAEASPIEQLPLGCRQILIHGDRDPDVPFEQSVRYAEAAGDEAELVTLEGAGHFEPIDPLARAWPQTLEAVERLLALE
jgi:acetyl esterase/lipase